MHTIRANGIDFAYLEAGEGPLVLLLHGFPDDPRTWSAQMEALAAAGYRAVAPFMRGYPPTGFAPDGRYDPEVLGNDVALLIDALGEEAAHVVGHDLGAVATYAATALHPERVSRATVIAVGHPQTFIQGVLQPRFADWSFHIWLFQHPDYGPAALQANDMGLVDYLWGKWTSQPYDKAHVDRVKHEVLGAPGAVEAALGWYHGLVNLPKEHPQAAERILGRTAVPTLTIFGADDPVHELSLAEGELFDAEYRFELLEGAAHHAHRDRPDEVNELVLDWLAADRDQPKLMAPMRSE